MNIHNLPLKLWLSGGMVILLSWIWLTGTMAQADQTLTLPTWQHLSTASGDLPVPSASGQQILALILDVDKDGVNDFVIGARGTPGPSMVWYRRDAAGWTRFVIETDVLQLGSNGAFHDIDSDGDLDVVGGNDSGGNQIWWWENPSPDFTPGIDWTRRIIKNTGAKNHHDMMFGNFDDDPATEFVFWNQGDKKLYLVDVPVDPSATQPWPGAVAIFTSPNNRYEGLAQADVDLDGKIDIIGAGYWFAHAGGASYTANLIEPMIYSRVAAAQFIPGGRPEIVQVSGEADGPARLLTWNGSAWIGSDLPGGPFARAHSLETADVNADGHLDIFIGEMRSLAAGEINPNARALLLLGDGLGGFTTSVVASGFGQHESKLGDLDGDGDIDILGKPFVWMTPRLDIWLNQGVNDSTSTPVLTGTPTVSFTETPTTVFTDTPTPVSTATPTVVPTNTSTPDPGGCPPTLEGNVIANPGFESGVTNWSFFTNAQGEFTTTTQDPFECAQSAQVSITTQGTNVYLSQANLPLQPNSAYQLRVAARSNTGRDVQPLITKQTSPFTNYGLRGVTLDLTPDWQVFTINFTTKGFVSPVLDGWLRFLMSNSNTPGDDTYFDYIALVLAPGVSTPTPTPTPTATATGTPGTPTTTPTPTVPPIGPVIDLWYGQNQSFGTRLGKQSDPQKWVNILGRVSPATGVSLSYRLNGGTSIPLTLGPNNRRLAEAGDFNIELDYTDLLPGANQVLITASSASGTTQVPVTVNYNGGSAWTPGTYSFNWGSAGQINEIAQVVDGQWTIDGSGVRPTILDYDRLVAIGDMSWKDYTVTVPITIFGIDPSGYNPPSGGPGVGFLTRWNGHFDDGGQPPQTGWTRLGALGWYRWEQINGVFTERLRLIGSSNKNIGSNIRQLSFGVTYNFKMQVESSSSPGVAAYYRFKVWPAAEAEPSIWDIQGLGNVSEPTGGSIVLVAHHVDALFGPVTVALTSVRPQPSLTVTTSGSGSGSVSLSPPGPTYRFGQDITLTAAPNGGSVFNGWSGAINGATNPVSIELFENQVINAIFGLSGQ